MSASLDRDEKPVARGVGIDGLVQEHLVELPCAVTLVDPRGDELPAQAPAGVRAWLRADPAAAVAELEPEPGTDVMVMTHSHALDLDIADAALQRAAHRSLGLIGPRRKWADFSRRLAGRGHAAETVASVSCPAGLPGIRGRQPAVIAVAVAAQLLLRETEERARSEPHVAG